MNRRIWIDRHCLVTLRAGGRVRALPLALACALSCVGAQADSQSAPNPPDGARLDKLEKRLETVEKKAARAEKLARQARRAARPPKRANSFNPAISLILNGAISGYSRHGDYALPGFALGDEAGLAPAGFSLGESELTIAANTDQYWRGQLTLSLADDAGETVSSVEEAFVETLGLGHGLTFRAGRFFSAMGYLNGKHAHAWNFSDAPLIYRGLFGDQFKQDGIRISYLAPTEHYLEFALEGGNGQSFPAGGAHAGIGDWVAAIKTGGDIGDSHSWLAGLSHFHAGAIAERAASAHLFSGDSRIDGLDLVYKWAPHGNRRERSLTLQAEYFDRSENGDLQVGNAVSPGFHGRQRGWYAEGVYKFRQQWRAGVRYDQVSSANTAANATLLRQAGLTDNGHDPYRISAMLEWSPSEFSRIRLQYDRDYSLPTGDDQLFLQYTQALGSHGAHSY